VPRESPRKLKRTEVELLVRAEVASSSLVNKEHQEDNDWGNSLEEQVSKLREQVAYLTHHIQQQSQYPDALDAVRVLVSMGLPSAISTINTAVSIQDDKWGVLRTAVVNLSKKVDSTANPGSTMEASTIADLNGY